MWDQTDEWAKEYKCSISYYMMSFISEIYQIILDRAVDTPGHGKKLVHGFNDVQKQYLATCFRMRSTKEEDKIDSKREKLALQDNVSAYWIFVIK